MLASIPKHCHLCLHWREQSVINLSLLLNDLLNSAIVIMLNQFFISSGFFFKLFGFHKHFLSLLQFRSSPISHIPLPIHATRMMFTFRLQFLQIVEIARLLGLLDRLHWSWSPSLFKTSHILQVIFADLDDLWPIWSLLGVMMAFFDVFL